MNKFLRIVGIVALVMIALGAAGAFYDNNTYTAPTLTQESKVNTARNAAKAAFIEGCVGEGALKSECACGFEALDNYFGYAWYSDEVLINRVVTEGYNYQETEAVIRCVGDSI